MIDKNQAIIDFLMECPQIAFNSTYFNFTNAKDNSKSIITDGNDRAINRPYIDGSVQKRYTFTIIDFRSMTDLAIPKDPSLVNENVEELLDVQGIIDWVTDKADNLEFPDFGEECLIDDMRTTSNNPILNGVDSTGSPRLAKYSMSIIIDYIDNSKKIS